MTGFHRLLAGHAFRNCQAGQKESLATSRRRRRPACGGPNRPIGRVERIYRQMDPVELKIALI